MDALYQVPKAALRQAAGVLQDAFRDDPLWNRFFAEVPDREKKLPAFYEVPLRLAHCYGDVLATSAALEGVVAWVPGHLSDLTFWRMIRSGALGAGLRLGPKVAWRLQRLFGRIEVDRRAFMRGRPYRYVQIVGVAPQRQGQGLGGALIRGLTERCVAIHEPLYLETETARNAEMYERLGFEVLKRIEIPNLDLPMWEMLWDPARQRAAEAVRS